MRKIGNKLMLFISAMLLGSVLTGGILYGLNLFVFQTPPEFKKLHDFYNVLDKNYVEPVDAEKLVDGAINGMIKALEDPYTTYMSPEESERFYEDIQNNFEGIGAEVREVNGQTVIVSPIKNSPAEKAGLQANDIILKANGVDLQGLPVQESVKHIRGPKGTEVTLLIQRPGLEEPFEVTIVRDTIPMESVFTKTLEDGMGLIQITKFSETTEEEFEDALEELRSQGVQGLIIDLRSNPGGLLNEVLAITETFVPKGELVVQVRYRDGSVQEYRSQSDPIDIPVVVLINQGSASASEIMAGALKESAGIPLVGMTTFGKGSVQTTVDYRDGSSLKYTVAEWLTPDGNQINEKGVAPDFEVELPEYAKLPYLYVEKTYSEGEVASEIATAQKYLDALGYSPGRTDGMLDRKTRDALAAFQTDAGIEAHGRLDDATAVKLVEALRNLVLENDTQLAKAKEVLRGQMKAR